MQSLKRYGQGAGHSSPGLAGGLLRKDFPGAQRAQARLCLRPGSRVARGNCSRGAESAGEQQWIWQVPTSATKSAPAHLIQYVYPAWFVAGALHLLLPQALNSLQLQQNDNNSQPRPAEWYPAVPELPELRQRRYRTPSLSYDTGLAHTSAGDREASGHHEFLGRPLSHPYKAGAGLPPARLLVPSGVR